MFVRPRLRSQLLGSDTVRGNVEGLRQSRYKAGVLLSKWFSHYMILFYPHSLEGGGSFISMTHPAALSNRCPGLPQIQFFGCLLLLWLKQDFFFFNVIHTASNLRSPCLYLPSPGTAGVCHPAQPCVAFHCHTSPRACTQPTEPSQLKDRISEVGVWRDPQA